MSDSTISYNSGSPHYVDEVERMKKIIVEREDEICGLYKECREYKRVIKRVDAELLQLHKDSDKVIGLLEKSVEKWAGLYEVAEKERDDLRAEIVELKKLARVAFEDMADGMVGGIE